MRFAKDVSPRLVLVTGPKPWWWHPVVYWACVALGLAGAYLAALEFSAVRVFYATEKRLRKSFSPAV